MAQGQTPSALTRADFKRIFSQLRPTERDLLKELVDKGEQQEAIRLLEIFHYFPGAKVE